MTSNNLLTVNVITYNQEKYIEKCLDSLITQKTNFGYIIRIFDDCSTDNTDKICREYAQKYPDKVFYFPNKENIGDVFNAKRSYDGIETKYYMYIEGDDYCCDDNKFQLQVSILEKHPECSFCSHQTMAVNLQDKVLQHSKWKYTFLRDEGIHSYKDLGVKHFICINPHISSRIVRTDCIDFEQCPRLYMFDATQTLMLLEKGDMYYINKVMTIYQQTGNGLFSGAKASHRVDHYTKHMLLYQEYSKGRLDLLVYKTIAVYVNYILSNLKDAKKSAFSLKLKSLQYYFIPPFIRDIITFPKNIFYKIKEEINYKLLQLMPNVKFFKPKAPKSILTIKTVEKPDYKKCKNDWTCLNTPSREENKYRICQCWWPAMAKRETPLIAEVTK